MINDEKELEVSVSLEDNGYTAYELLNEINISIGILQGLEDIDMNLYPNKKRDLILKWVEIIEVQTTMYQAFYE